MMHQHHRTIVFDKLKRRLRCRNLSPHLVKNDLSKASKINRKSFKLSNSNNLQYLANGLPVVCMVALLGIMAYSINVGTVFDYVEKTYAADGEGNTNESPDPVATISVSPGGDHAASSDQPTLVAQTGMAYRSHAVNVNVKDVTKYSLQISYAVGEDNLRLMNSNAYLAGAGGKTPASMADNTWGFAWVTDKDADYSLPDDQMTYYTMPQTGTLATNLASGLLANADTYNDDFNGKLVFAAKFGDNATSGRYKTQVMLSLTASAKEVVTTLDDIFQMQQMTPEICASSVIGERSSLQDVRDGNSYTVQKLSDGRCWMTQNLRLTGNSITAWKTNNPDDDNNLRLTSKYSDVSENSTYTLPNSASPWATSDDTSVTLNNVHDPYYADPIQDKHQYGAYYTWSAATAGTGDDSKLVSGMDASHSICPKGWRLPTGGEGGELQTLHNHGNLKVGSFVEESDSGYWLGASESNAAGAAFFPTASAIAFSKIASLGSDGFYWSSTVYSSNRAHILYLTADSADPVSYGRRFFGYSVRCVASGSKLELIETMQEMTPEVCQDSPVGSLNRLMDVRDGNQYFVQKLDDNNCWMLQNLSLTNGSVTSWKASHPDNSNNVKLSSKYSNVPVGSTYTLPTTSFSNDKMVNATLTSNNAIYGTYYSWCAATAGSCSDAVTDNTEAQYSVCPKGWRLPTGKVSSANDPRYNYSFARLAVDQATDMQITASKAWQEGYVNARVGIASATNGVVLGGGFFPAAGMVNTSSTSSSVGTIGYYWSSTGKGPSAVGTLNAYYMNFTSREFNAATEYYLYTFYGASVRCVAPSSENL